MPNDQNKHTIYVREPIWSAIIKEIGWKPKTRIGLLSPSRLVTILFLKYLAGDIELTMEDLKR